MFMKKTKVKISLVIGLIGFALGAVALAVNSMAEKWRLRLGIFAVILIIIAIRGIVKIIKKQKNNPMSNNESATMVTRSDILFNSQRPNASDYGYNDHNPIMTSSTSSTKEYLARLRTLDGDPFTWKYIGLRDVTEHCGVRNVIIDYYQLYLNGIEFKTIYFCPFGHDHSYAPEGMMLVEEEKEEQKTNN